MIERVSWGKGGQEQTSSGGLVIPGDRLHEIRVVQHGYSLVAKSKRIFQELNNVGFGLHVLRPLPFINVVRRFVAGDRRPDQIIRCSDMLQLLTEGTQGELLVSCA